MPSFDAWGWGKGRERVGNIPGHQEKTVFKIRRVFGLVLFQ
jgi:hypothetical protein